MPYVLAQMLSMAVKVLRRSSWQPMSSVSTIPWSTRLPNFCTLYELRSAISWDRLELELYSCMVSNP